MDKLTFIQEVAKAEALQTGLATPAKGSLKDYARFLMEYGKQLYGKGDPNGDSQKRNLSVEIFVEFEPDAWRRQGKMWLERHAGHSNDLWHKEWVSLLNTADDEDLAKILLSSDEESIRQRISQPWLGLMSFQRVLEIKREGRQP